MFKVGMVLGKFYPFHKGHAFLINTAVSQCDEVYVFVCSLPTDKYKGEDRARWIKNHYSMDPSVHVIHIDEVLPQEPKDHPDFWNIWVRVVKSHVPIVEAIFTSEPYGTPFAQHLGIKHVMVDEFRLNTPISGTKARGDIYGNWRFLPTEVKQHFKRKVCVVGPESTGKTTMVRHLTRMFDMKWVMEYGREYCQTHDTTTLTAGDFLRIVEGQIEREDEAFKQANGILFCDTDPLTTLMFYRLYCEKGTCEPDHHTETLLLDQAERHYDLYILLDPSVDHVQDGQRDFGVDAKRWEIFNRFEAALQAKEAKYVVIRGNDYADRIQQAGQAVDNLIATLR
jgi:HTH-type transcriptional repressor of NAD biosynthesis genes